MKTMLLQLWLITCLSILPSCKKEELSFSGGDIQIEVKTGQHWLHDFPLFLGINKKNPPQFAIWIEDTNGHYISTVFATYKIAAEAWQANGGNRRKESLPHWCHQRGVVYPDGLMLPTKKQPLTDGITGATPKEDKTIQITPLGLSKPFVVKAEFNHSTDFNAAFPEGAKPSDWNYSGGDKGSGQPAVVYAATVDTDTKVINLELLGHSSPDGSDGAIYSNLNQLTTATTIVKNITITIK